MSAVASSLLTVIICVCVAGTFATSARNYCETSGCQQTCIELNPGFQCGCHPGYVLQPDNATCLPEPFCHNGNNNCGAFTECIEYPANATFGCRCLSGTHGLHLAVDAHNVTRQVCDDIDDCADKNNNPCSTDPNATCVNVPRSSYCQCPAGYEWDAASGKCVDIDECLRHLDDCGLYNLTYCVNTVASFTCPCVSGPRGEVWYMKGVGTKSCRDIDECRELSPNPCASDPFTECQNIVTGGYECRALQGFVASRPCVTMDPLSPLASCDACRNATDPPARNINECSETKCPAWVSKCSTHTVCVDYAPINGTAPYACPCTPPVSGIVYAYTQATQFTCVDVNECAIGTHQCWGGTRCINLEGGYYCRCNVYDTYPDTQAACDAKIPFLKWLNGVFGGDFNALSVSVGKCLYQQVDAARVYGLSPVSQVCYCG